MVDATQPKDKNWGRKVQGRAKNTCREVVDNRVFQAILIRFFKLAAMRKGRRRLELHRQTIMTEIPIKKKKKKSNKGPSKGKAH